MTHALFVVLTDLAIASAAGIIVWSLVRLARQEYMADAMESLKSRRRVRIAFYVACVYFGIGLLDQIAIPGLDPIRDKSVLDVAFSVIPQERTYSAPFASFVTGITPGTEQEPVNRVKGIHLLGTDVNGYDVLYNVTKGSGTALILAFGTSFVTFPIGILLGIMAGYFGKRTDDLIQWLYTTISSIPWLLFVIAFLMVFGRGLLWICLAIGLTSWVDLARLIRGETLKQKSLDYVTAARAAGIPTFRILIRHLLPNMMHLVIITFTLSSSSVILAESILTFIGIGVEPGTASWGVMLVEAQKELMRSPRIWWVFGGASFVGILPLVLSLNVLGDALRDALDPRLKGTS
ncbi:MAG: ABC transporter permease [Spirochaetia bacterium]|nr:ABC transporter permease [Spirochaetia bacterium]